LADEKGITLRGLEAARECGTVFMESYTSTLSEGSVERLQDLIGKDIILLDREGVEGGDAVLEKAKVGVVCLLVPGDPMSATTHQDLRLRAQELGLATEIIGGVSALTAIPAALGLQIYKFGKTITVPIPQPNFNPTSFYEKALENFKAGMHTLLLLDIQQDKGLYLSANDSLKTLISIEKELKGGLMIPERLVCVAARAGSADSLFRPLHSLVIPGELHFLEAKALVEFCNAPKEILKE